MVAEDDDGAIVSAARPVVCEGDARIAAREVEAILRQAFTFPEALDQKVTNASAKIAARLLVHCHQINELFYADARGSA
ncbi:hypothetical protein FV218_12280 [Methylobacterium sp. WL69]|uniref:hypothetical protein n=1 Tax=Methylobacterium sp. WL69 TaxID=2603893 RepID=UPI0011C8160F|nr:hypothetical protein [Methylobacterium sp. WL69]TXM72909.1 hypothetical protein FV218_12280 [Methylobacterium sp. WL69]